MNVCVDVALDHQRANKLIHMAPFLMDVPVLSNVWTTSETLSFLPPGRLDKITLRTAVSALMHVLVTRSQLKESSYQSHPIVSFICAYRTRVTIHNTLRLFRVLLACVGFSHCMYMDGHWHTAGEGMELHLVFRSRPDQSSLPRDEAAVVLACRSSPALSKLFIYFFMLFDPKNIFGLVFFFLSNEKNLSAARVK